MSAAFPSPNLGPTRAPDVAVDRCARARACVWEWVGGWVGGLANLKPSRALHVVVDRCVCVCVCVRVDVCCVPEDGWIAAPRVLKSKLSIHAHTHTHPPTYPAKRPPPPTHAVLQALVGLVGILPLVRPLRLCQRLTSTLCMDMGTPAIPG